MTPSPHHPIGAKGVGESPNVGSPAAFVNAVIDALSPLGVRHIDMPLTRDKVWRAIRDAQKTGSVRVNLAVQRPGADPAGLDAVWAFVTDPEKVGRVPAGGAVEVNVHDPTHFDAVVKVAVGPVRGKFKFKVELAPDEAARRIDMKITGGGFGSAVDLTAGAELVAAATAARS